LCCPIDNCGVKEIFVKNKCKSCGIIVVIAAIGLSMTACLSVQMPHLGPRPVVLTVTGIPPAHQGRLAEVYILSIGTGLDAFLGGDGIRAELGLATSQRAHIRDDGSVTIEMMEAGTEEPFTTSGLYVIGIVIWTPETILPLLPPIPPLPVWGGVTADLNITGGPQAVAFNSFAGLGLDR